MAATSQIWIVNKQSSAFVSKHSKEFHSTVHEKRQGIQNTWKNEWNIRQESFVSFVYITATPAADHWPVCYPLFAIQKISHLHDRSDSTTRTPWTGVTGWRRSLPRWAAATTSSTPSCRSTCQTTQWEPALTCSTSRSERCWEFILHFWTQTGLFEMHGIAETCSLTCKFLSNHSHVKTENHIIFSH